MRIENCHWTQLPNDFIDEGGIVLVGPAAACIYWCIARRTKGWQKDTDALSYSQLAQMTGFSRATLASAIASLLKHDLIIALKSQGMVTKYSLNLSTSSKTELDQFKNQTGSLNTRSKNELVSSPNSSLTSSPNSSSIILRKDTPLSPESPPVSPVKKVPKIAYGENVRLTEEEHGKLLAAYGTDATRKLIERLDNYKGAKGKTYKSDYRAILSWVVEAVGVGVKVQTGPGGIKGWKCACGYVNRHNGGFCLQCREDRPGREP